jgi:hypothetical protein
VFFEDLERHPFVGLFDLEDLFAVICVHPRGSSLGELDAFFLLTDEE